MGVKEGTSDKPWVLYVNDESLNSTPETNIALYVNELEFKLEKMGAPGWLSQSIRLRLRSRTHGFWV